MSEWHVELVQVGSVEKHPNADTLSVAEIHGGYPVIIRTGEFNEGDVCVYVPVDSVVPDTEYFAFLQGKRRVKAKKIRGIYSQGLLLPLSLLPPSDVPFTLGALVHEELGIHKWEPKEELAVSGGQQEPGPEGWEFIKYTDIEGLRRYKNILEIGEEVVITEKIHGCVTAQTHVTMSDGSKKKITDVAVNDEVLGVDIETGRVQPTRVTNVWKNGKSEKWLRIQTTRKHVKNGNSFIRLICTPEHKIFVKNGLESSFKRAGELQEGETILIHRKDIFLPDFQKQVLAGMILGDASVGGKGAWSVCWGHSEKDEEYMRWISRALGDVFDPRGEGSRISGFGSTVLTGRSIWSYCINDAFSCFKNENGKKIIPSNIAEFLTPVSLAFWFMDDGSTANTHEAQLERPSIATCSFTEEECQLLAKSLKEKFNIEPKVTNHDYPRLVFSSSEAEKFYLLIAPFIPKCMQRKLPERYRGHEGWLPSLDGQDFFTQLVEQTVTSITDVTESEKSLRYDLETELHNYFANEILVHNSNGRFCWDGERLWAGSRNEIKKQDGGTFWWQVAEKLNLAECFKKFPKTIFFGEIYGKSVQDLSYGLEGRSFIVFDSFDVETMKWNDFIKTQDMADEAGLDVVPVLYSGPWLGFDAHSDLAEGKSTVANHVREGFVVKPVTERWDRRFGRVILKLVGQNYLLRKDD